MRYRICVSISEIDEAFKKMIDELKRIADVDVVGLDGFSLKDYDIFIGKKLTMDCLATANRLKIIFAYKTGVDDFPLAEIKRRNILVVNSHANSKVIAQYSFGLAVSMANRITEFDRKFREGIWYDKDLPYWETIYDMKIGLLGFGHIGREIHQLLCANGIETYTLNRGKKYPDSIHTVTTLEELCDKTNMLIISLPKTSDTDVLIDRSILQHMAGKYIVNVGRSNCIDQQALYDALKSEESLAGAAIDTWDKKPFNNDGKFYPTTIPFIHLDNVVLSPHQAMKVKRGHELYVTDITRKVIAYIQEGALSDVIDLTKGY